MLGSQGDLTLKKAKIAGNELEYDTQGSGEPVVLIHGGVTNEIALLAKEPVLANRYHLITYNRRGYFGSTHPERPVTIAEGASDCVKLMAHVGVERAHVVGHSIGGQIALQVARDYPDRVRTLALLEPFLLTQAPSGQAFVKETAHIFEMYQGGDKAGAIKTMLTEVGGPGTVELIERRMPYGMRQVIADVDTPFQVDFPGGQSWSFTAEDARQISQPVLLVVGAETIPLFKEIAKLVTAWFPGSESLVIPNAPHAMILPHSGAVAEGLAGFLARHP